MSLIWREEGDADDPWLEAVGPLNLAYTVDALGKGYKAQLLDQGGAVLWTDEKRTQEAAKAACQRHAEGQAKAWLRLAFHRPAFADWLRSFVWKVLA